MAVSTPVEYTTDGEDLRAAERAYLDARRRHYQLPEPGTGAPLAGLAVSGGGIRSAIFALGVMQCLARLNLLRKFDYLSTVSGGGYIGSALTWALHRKWGTQIGRFDVSAERFPFGARRPGTQKTPMGLQFARGKDRLLRHLTRHGNYLTPGNGITAASLAAVVLRSAILSFFVYGAIAVCLFALLLRAGALNPASFMVPHTGYTICLPNYVLLVAAAAVIVFVIACVVYSFCSWLLNTRQGTERMDGWLYRMRRQFEIGTGWLIGVILVVALFGAVPPLGDLIHRHSSQTLDYLTGAGSAFAGWLAGIFAFFRSRRAQKADAPPSLLASVAAALMLAGVLMLAYRFAVVLDAAHTLTNVAILGAAALFIGLFTDLNHTSIHRYYRDRLMEMFLPDINRVWSADEAVVTDAPEANRAPLSGMIPPAQPSGGLDESEIVAPYHIINTNVILTGSPDPKRRGRGGDNFILSPLYSGSAATGWLRTASFVGGKLSLATAMAISGAAVNPNTGVSGRGAARSPVVAIIMGLLGVRLGYWVHNPNPQRRPLPLFHAPNFIYPGLRSLLPLGKLKERSRTLELSDGGHFENLAAYELIRRKLKLILVLDGGADPEFTFSDLANLIERVRSDFGAKIILPGTELAPLIPGPRPEYGDEHDMRAAHSPFLIAEIQYADDPDGEPSGRLVYLNTVFLDDLPADLFGYKLQHELFPDQPTTDQFFDEAQFEAYRELGYQLARKLTDACRTGADSPRDVQDPVVRTFFG